MLSELRKKKFTNGFRVMDTQQKGYLERADFEGLARRLAEVRGVRLSSEEGEMLVARYVFIWEGVKKIADTDRNNRVDLEEWLVYHEQLLSKRESFEDLIENLASFLFDLLDLNGDGKITIEEHKLFLQAHQIAPGLAEEIFPKLDQNRDGHLSRDEVLSAVQDFYYSDDSNAAGNLLFGPF